MRRPCPRLAAMILLLALAHALAPRAEAQNGQDVPTMSNDGTPAASPNYGRPPLEPGLTLGQLNGVAEEHTWQPYSLGGLKLLDVYEGTKHVSPTYWVFEVTEPSSGMRTYGISASTFCFYTRNTPFAKDVRAAMTRHPGLRVSVVFRFGSPYMEGSKRAHGGEVSRVSFFGPDGKRVEDVDDAEF